MLHFANPHMLWLGMMIPFIVLLYWYYRQWRKSRIGSLGSRHVLSNILIGTRNAHGLVKFLLQIAAFSLLVVAVAQPQVANRTSKKVIRGSDVIICLDISNSMLVEDIKPNRLIRARQAIASLLKQLDEEQVGLVVFAGEAYIQVPLTVDKAATTMLLNTINNTDITNQGTAIADAISLAVRSFGPASGKRSGQSIILVTDGEDHEGNTLEEARKAASQGISIYTLGVGNPTGVPIPIYENGVLTGYKKDAEGNTVVSSLNPKLLAEVAEVTGGQFFLSSNLNVAMQRIKTEIVKKHSGEKMMQSPDQYTPEFGWFAGLAILLLVIEQIIPYSGHRRKLIDRIGGTLYETGKVTDRKRGGRS
jgi:Ca-activated chloride channel homolog